MLLAFLTALGIAEVCLPIKGKAYSIILFNVFVVPMSVIALSKRLFFDSLALCRLGPRSVVARSSSGSQTTPCLLGLCPRE